jgi:hypothetical protein
MTRSRNWCRPASSRHALPPEHLTRSGVQPLDISAARVDGDLGCNFERCWPLFATCRRKPLGARCRSMTKARSARAPRCASSARDPRAWRAQGTLRDRRASSRRALRKLSLLVRVGRNAGTVHAAVRNRRTEPVPRRNRKRAWRGTAGWVARVSLATCMLSGCAGSRCRAEKQRSAAQEQIAFWESRRITTASGASKGSQSKPAPSAASSESQQVTEPRVLCIDGTLSACTVGRPLDGCCTNQGGVFHDSWGNVVLAR